MSQIAFSSRSSLVSSLHSRAAVFTSQIQAVESEIRSVQFEQAQRSDEHQTRQNGYSHPKSRGGRQGIKGCRDRINTLSARRTSLLHDLESVQSEARYQETITAAQHRPAYNNTPMRKL